MHEPKNIWEEENGKQNTNGEKGKGDLAELKIRHLKKSNERKTSFFN